MKEHKIFYINSKNRSSGTHSDMNYRLDMHDIQPDHIMVLQANIPKSYYMVQEGLNTFILIEDSISAIISIPIGNYNRNSFKLALQIQLNASSPNNWTYSVSVPLSSVSDTGKYTFGVTNNTGLQPSFVFNSSNIAELIGFDTDTTYPWTNSTISSANVIKLQKEDTLFIRSDIVSFNSSGVLQEINAVNSSDFDNIIYMNTNGDRYAKEMNGNSNNVYRFTITNENGETMNLNGQNYTMTICVFKEDNSRDMIKQYIKYKLAGNK